MQKLKIQQISIKTDKSFENPFSPVFFGHLELGELIVLIWVSLAIPQLPLLPCWSLALDFVVYEAPFFKKQKQFYCSLHDLKLCSMLKHKKTWEDLDLYQLLQQGGFRLVLPGDFLLFRSCMRSFLQWKTCLAGGGQSYGRTKGLPNPQKVLSSIMCT